MSDKNGQRQMDVSDREMDSVGRTSRTERRTVSDGRVRQGRVALDERRQYGDTVETEETEEMETRLIFRIEYKRLHE